MHIQAMMNACIYVLSIPLYLYLFTVAVFRFISTENMVLEDGGTFSIAIELFEGTLDVPVDVIVQNGSPPPGQDGKYLLELRTQCIQYILTI